MMELPVYQRPSLRVVTGQVGSAVREFLVLAGTVIFATSVVIWALSYYPRPAEIHEAFEAKREAVRAELAPEQHEAALETLDAAEGAAYLEQSWLARGGKAMQPVFEPAGFDWRITVGILAAFPARELILPSLEGAAEQPDGLRETLRASMRPDGSHAFTPLVALGLMVFFALCSQCMGTLAAIRRETRSWRWPVFVFSYMTVLAWLVAVALFQVGTALGLGGA
jgi:ferrous iron transport protein B